MLFAFVCVSNLPAQELDDILAFSGGNDMPCKIIKEDANFVHFKAFAGAPIQTKEWGKVSNIQYGEISQNMKIAESDFENGSYNTCLAQYEKVLKDNAARTWEKTKATYRMAISYSKIGKMDKASELFKKIDATSRWYNISQLDLIETLPDAEKTKGIKDLLNGGKVSGPFLIRLKFMLLDRSIAEGKTGDATKVYGELKSEAKDKADQDLLEEYSIMIEFMGGNLSGAESKIKQKLSQKQDSSKLRIILGEIYKKKQKNEEALFEFLRAKYMFDTDEAEASYKAGQVFLDLHSSDKEKFSEYRIHARKELNNAKQLDDPIWSVKANKLLSQL